MARTTHHKEPVAHHHHGTSHALIRIKKIKASKKAAKPSKALKRLAGGFL